MGNQKLTFLSSGTEKSGNGLVFLPKKFTFEIAKETTEYLKLWVWDAWETDLASFVRTCDWAHLSSNIYGICSEINFAWELFLLVISFFLFLFTKCFVKSLKGCEAFHASEWSFEPILRCNSGCRSGGWRKRRREGKTGAYWVLIGRNVVGLWSSNTKWFWIVGLWSSTTKWFWINRNGPLCWTFALGRSTEEEFDFPLKLKLLLVKLEDSTFLDSLSLRLLLILQVKILI